MLKMYYAQENVFVSVHLRKRKKGLLELPEANKRGRREAGSNNQRNNELGDTMNREIRRKTHSKVNKMPQNEIDAILAQYIHNVLSMSFLKRVKFGFSVIFRGINHG